MTVYVDDMRAGYGRLVMCHMLADDLVELLQMADRIGVDWKWLQCAGTPKEHFDIALSKRKLAVAAGAVEITWRQAGAMSWRRRIEGKLGSPAEAEAWLSNHYRSRGST